MTRLDHDTARISVFATFADLLFSMSEYGYVPTIHPWSEAHKRVRAALTDRGLRVFPTSGATR